MIISVKIDFISLAHTILYCKNVACVFPMNLAKYDLGVKVRLVSEFTKVGKTVLNETTNFQKTKWETRFASLSYA